MKCYVHEEEQAVGICKNCFKAVCRKCAIPDDRGFLACSETCRQELLITHEMTERAKMAYGLKPGRLPATILFILIVGLGMVVFGLFTLQAGMAGIFAILMGLLLLLSSGIYYYNQRKSGIRS
jgi:hypothetical protein